MTRQPWQAYEELATQLLDRFREDFGLSAVEGKHRVPGRTTTWELDAKGVLADGAGIVVVECRNRKSRTTQEEMGALAYKIRDVRAEGGFIVTPVPPQKGAAMIAERENIQHVFLTADNTITEYLMRFLNRVFLGMCDGVAIQDDVKLVLTTSDTN